MRQSFALKRISKRVGGMTLIDASGWSNERELHLQWRGQKIAYDLVPKIKIEIIVPDEVADSVIQSILGTAKTEEGHAGDGIIFISTIDNSISIGGPAAEEVGERQFVSHRNKRGKKSSFRFMGQCIFQTMKSLSYSNHISLWTKLLFLLLN